MLTYGDFYNQLKSTGFGDCETAARFLSAKFNSRFTDDQFSLFVDYVTFVRDAIRVKNVDNKLDGNQFEKKFRKWLEKPRDWTNRKNFDDKKRFLKINAKDRLAFRRDDKTRISENETSFTIKIETERNDDFLGNIFSVERVTKGRKKILEVSPAQKESESEKPLLVDRSTLDETDNSALKREVKERVVSDTGTKLEYKHEVKELSISLDLAELEFFQRDTAGDVFDVKKERYEMTEKTNEFGVIKSRKRKCGADEIKVEKSRTKKNKKTKPKENNLAMRASRRKKGDLASVSDEAKKSLPYLRLDSELVPEKVRIDRSEPRFEIRDETENMEKTELNDFPNSHRSEKKEDRKDGNDENVEESEDERRFLLKCDPDSDDYYVPGEDTSEEEYHPPKLIGMRKTRAHTRALREKKGFIDKANPVVTRRSFDSENVATLQNSRHRNVNVETAPIDFLEGFLGNDAFSNREEVLGKPSTSRLVDRSRNKAPRRNVTKRKIGRGLKRKKKGPKKKKGKEGGSEPPDYDYVSEISSGDEFSPHKPTLPQNPGQKRENPLFEKDENDKYRCTIKDCPKSYSGYPMFVRHMRRKHELLLLECKRCDKGFVDRALLCYHKDLEHNDGSGSFECSLCPMRFRTAGNLAKHDLSTHDVAYDHTCDHCEELFADKASKMDHIFSSHPEDNVCCLICKRYFNDEKASVTHYKTSHDGEHVLKCDFCDKAFFVLRKSLTYHVELNHPDRSCWDKPLRCKILRCQLSFSTSENFSQHNQSRHEKNDGESSETKKPEMKKPKEMSVCELCGKSFVKDRLHFHLMTHNSSLEFECDRCEGRYGSSLALRKHKQSVHTGRRFQCPQCPAVFHRYETLENHIGAVHERRKQSCNECDKTYAFRADLLGHIRAVHRGIKSVCRYCKKYFLRSSERNRHEKSVHRDESDEERDDERDDELQVEQDEQDEQSDQQDDEQNKRDKQEQPDQQDDEQNERDDKFDDEQNDKLDDELNENEKSPAPWHGRLRSQKRL